jgi:hypothetical protein
MQNLDLATMSTVCVVGDAWTEATLRQKTRELFALADEIDSVRAAKKKFDEAAGEVERFKARQSALNDRAIALSKILAASREGLRRAILAGDDFEDAAFTKQGVAQTEFDGCSAALEMLVAEILPAANADLFAARLDYFYARAAGILCVANERALKIGEQLGPIADSEGSIEVHVGQVPTISALMGERHHLIDLVSRGRKDLDAIREDLKARGNLKKKG